MSDDTSRAEESLLDVDSVLDLAVDWYHVPTLAVTMLFMLWVRLQAMDRHIRDGKVFFSGNDPWYHYRQVQYTVDHWPAIMPFDPWTGFPYGTAVGQFGTLYDQLVATAALVVGLGSPSDNTVAMVLLVTPAVFGMLLALPTYAIGKRLGGRLAGLFGAALIALMPGTILNRSVVGAADHNIAEPVFQATAVLAMMVAVTVAERERPVYEQVAAREFASLRRPVGFAVLAGVATALYLWVWPPGVVLLGIFGIFFVIKLSADYVRGVSPDHLGVVAAVSMSVTGVLSLIPMMEASFSAVAPSLLQPFVALAVAVGAVFMAWLGRQWERRQLSPALYPVAVGGLILVGVLVVRFGSPGLYSSLIGNLSRVTFLVRQSAQVGTVAEATTLFDQATRLGIEWYWYLYTQYGLAFFTALVAAVLVIVRTVLTGEHRAERLLVLVWFAFTTSMAFSQVRFNYYLVVPVVVLNAYLLSDVLRFVGVESLSDRVEDVEWYQVMAVFVVVLLVALPLLATSTVGNQGQRSFSTATETGARAGPGGVVNWADTLHWMRDNTPVEGTYGGAGNEMEYYPTVPRTDDYDYPAGSYGVMSWWDYGHWITVEGERIPNANPFQQQATDAANFLLAPNESAAESVAESLSEDDAKTRFVLVDWQMVSPTSKFGAPAIFYSKPDVSGRGDFYRPVYQRTNSGARPLLYLKDQRYYESMMIRLYRYHGSAMQPNPRFVIDWDPLRSGGRTFYFAPQGNRSVVRSFQTMAQARQFVERDGSAQVGGIGQYPSEYVPALQHYRLVQVSDAPAPRRVRVSSPRLSNTPTWVKAFERVPGATVEGEGPPNATVTAGVRLFIPSQNSTFVYTQRAETGPDGGFEMTLPYSSTGYDEFGPSNGYTNVSVRATGPYSFRTSLMRGGEKGLSTVQWTATANVSEAQVVGADESSVQVTLEERVISRPEGANSSTAPANDTSAPTDNSTGTGNETDSAISTQSGSLAPLTRSGSETRTVAAEPARFVGSL